MLDHVGPSCSQATPSVANLQKTWKSQAITGLTLRSHSPVLRGVWRILLTGMQQSMIYSHIYSCIFLSRLYQTEGVAWQCSHSTYSKRIWKTVRISEVEKTSSPNCTPYAGQPQPPELPPLVLPTPDKHEIACSGKDIQYSKRIWKTLRVTKLWKIIAQICAENFQPELHSLCSAASAAWTSAIGAFDSWQARNSLLWSVSACSIMQCRPHTQKPLPYLPRCVEDSPHRHAAIHDIFTHLFLHFPK